MHAPQPKLDAAVLARAQQGDRAAHGEIYALFATAVFTLARRMLASRALAEDVLQETFIEVLRKIGTYRGEAEFGTWVKRIAINKCLMHLRSAWVVRGAADGESLLPHEAARGVELDEQITLDRALDRLSATARVVVWLHDVEGYTHQEIGRMTGRSASFSKSQLARAHERLRCLLEDRPEESATDLCAPALKTC